MSCLIPENNPAEWVGGVAVEWGDSGQADWDNFFLLTDDGVIDVGEIQKITIVNGKIPDPAVVAGDKSSPILTMRATKANVAKTLRISETEAATRATTVNLPGRFVVSLSADCVQWWQVSQAAVNEFING